METQERKTRASGSVDFWGVELVETRRLSEGTIQSGTPYPDMNWLTIRTGVTSASLCAHDEAGAREMIAQLRAGCDAWEEMLAEMFPAQAVTA